MNLENLKPARVFKYFEELCGIPHGSGDMNRIADYCVEFAKSHSLEYKRDSANNVVIYKNATAGYENAEPIILQGHLDMVCQQTEDRNIDFSAEGLQIFVDGDFVKARGTTLGADNGIAVAMVLAILESDEYRHPRIEAVFTTDEEIGMVGAKKLDMSLLSGRKMVNIDSEEQNAVTVSCAGGSDFKVCLPISRIKKSGTEVTVLLKSLKGGHSGIEIDKGRVNANMLAGRFLNSLVNNTDFDIISIDGGDKGNAIPNLCKIRLCVDNATEFVGNAEKELEIIKAEIAEREKDFAPVVNIGENAEFDVLNNELKNNLIFALLCAPNGIIEMSASIKGLVETSLNLGILATDESEISMLFALRSNKKSAHIALEDKLKTFFGALPCQIEASGHYPPWEFKENSELQNLYKSVFAEKMGYEPEIVAIHAGLECGTFADALSGLDCISIGPDLFDVHTVNEKMSISSVDKIFDVLVTLLEKFV